jgi:two-component system chemotaxis response regulator CheY
MATNNIKILLVDDDESLRQMYNLILTKAGYNVTKAIDGIDGLAKAREGGFDLVLLDLMMPNLDGIGMLKGLLDEGPKKPNGPMVVLSNAGYDNVAKEAISLGAVGFLMKAELLPKDLTKAVEDFLEKNKTTKAPEAWKKGRPE